MMSKRTTRTALVIGSMACILGSGARAEVVEYDDKEAWENGVGQFTTIGFADLPDGTWVSEQYADFGVHFVDGWDQVVYGEITFPED